jgi:hypothetical protein
MGHLPFKTNNYYNPWKLNSPKNLEHLIEFPFLLIFLGKKNMNEITSGIELTTTMPEDEALGIPFEKWDGSLPSCTMLDTCNNCACKGMLTNSNGGANVNNLSFETSLEEQTTYEGLQE